jgi:hypothetical protein
MHAFLNDEEDEASLTEGFLGGVHELRVIVSWSEESLGLVRQLPALTKLQLQVKASDDDDDDDDDPAQWPPFIPPSLRALRIDLESGTRPELEPLMCALPGMLGASGARLDRLEVTLPKDVRAIGGDGLVHLAQTLRCCSPTLKGFLLGTWDTSCIHIIRGNLFAHEYADQVEELREQWQEVLAGVSACRELQVLVLPRIKVEPLFPPGTTFGRLTHLEIGDHKRQDPPNAGVLGLWELMASGGLPALAKLKVLFEGRRVGGDEVRTRVAPALQAVAGTLTRLHLDGWASESVDMGYEWGVAVGKLRRLKDLALGLSYDGRFYHAFARGLTASGGNPPLPLLWRVVQSGGVGSHADLLASLLLPSVRVFVSDHWDAQAALMTACAVRQAGYKHTLVLGCREPDKKACILGVSSTCTVVRGIHEYFSDSVYALEGVLGSD